MGRTPKNPISIKFLKGNKNENRAKTRKQIRRWLIVAESFLIVLYIMFKWDSRSEIGMNLFAEVAGMIATYLIVDYVDQKRDEAPRTPTKRWVYFRMRKIIDELLEKMLPAGIPVELPLPANMVYLIDQYLVCRTSSTLEMRPFKEARKDIDYLFDHSALVVDAAPMETWLELCENHLDTIKNKETWKEDAERWALATTLSEIFGGLIYLRFWVQTYLDNSKVGWIAADKRSP